MRYKVCVHCDSDFIQETPGQKYCSVRCKTAGSKIVKKSKTFNKEVRLKRAKSCAAWKAENYLKSRISALKHRALKENVFFDLTEQDFTVPEICPVLGIPMDGRDKNHQWSFDRLVPALGYTKENVRVISMKANRIKNNASLEDLEKIVEYLKKESK